MCQHAGLYRQTFPLVQMKKVTFPLFSLFSLVFPSHPGKVHIFHFCFLVLSINNSLRAVDNEEENSRSTHMTDFMSGLNITCSEFIYSLVLITWLFGTLSLCNTHLDPNYTTLQISDCDSIVFCGPNQKIWTISTVAHLTELGTGHFYLCFALEGDTKRLCALTVSFPPEWCRLTGRYYGTYSHIMQLELRFYWWGGGAMQAEDKTKLGPFISNRDSGTLEAVNC